MGHILTVPYQPQPDWEQAPTVSLTHTGWLSPCSISATAQCCHDGENLWIRMEAEESPIRAMAGPLEPVCCDSCLEFFFAPLPDDPRYFNLEWNPLGTLYLGFGADRPTRIRQIPKQSDAIFCPHPYPTPNGWGVTFRLPLSFLRLYFPGYTLSGEAAGNFYKCGDETDTPHYLAWAPLSCDRPDFHRRQDFGILRFSDAPAHQPSII